MRRIKSLQLFTAFPVAACFVSCAFALMDCDPSRCNGWIFEGKAFYGGVAGFCWPVDDKILYGCETNTGIWIPYVSANAPDTVCHGSFDFQIFNVTYHLVGSTFSPGNLTLSWYLARLPDNEGKGWFYCSNVVGSEVRVFYYNGSYYDVVTDANGFITKVPQRQQQRQLTQYGDIAGIPGCETGCCWLRDVYYDTTNNNYADGVREYFYMQSKWYIKNDTLGTYELYTGHTAPGMAKCFMRYLTDMQWNSSKTFTVTTTPAALNTYLASNGTVYIKRVINQTYSVYDDLIAMTPTANYITIVTTALSEASANGILYLSVEGSVFSYIPMQNFGLVFVNNGTPSFQPISTIPPSNSSWSEANYVGKYPVPKTCGLQTCSGMAFYSSITPSLLCLTSDEFLTFCNENLGVFVPMTNQSVPTSICGGNFVVQIMSAKYWLNGSVVLRDTPNGWVVVTPNAFIFSWYLSRLRPYEGTGQFYCSYNSPTFYSNGVSFYNAATNALGYIVKTQISQIKTYFFKELDEPGCTDPVCCWFTEYYIAPKNIKSYTEFRYLGNMGWTVWYQNAWTPYTGEFNKGILECAQYFNDFEFTNSTDGAMYSFYRGSMYQLDATGARQGKADFRPEDYPGNDPLATGGFYYSKPLVNGSYSLTGIYQNVSGIWLASIKNGQFIYKKLPPNCNDSFGFDTPPACYSTTNEIELNRNDRTICDPFTTLNTCGSGYYCKDFYEVLSVPPATCSMGFCVPDYAKTYCLVTTTRTRTTTSLMTTTSNLTTSSNLTTTAMTTTPAPFTTPQRYGQFCNYDSDCYTQICTNHKCTCSDCTKYLPYIEYNWRYLKFFYDEKCIPKDSVIGGLGDTCDMWADVPTTYCAFGLHCSKCPENWNAIYADATCTAYTFSSVPSDYQCPEEFTCGYRAKCTMINADTPVCLCPPGYHLEDNGLNCYGWNVSSVGPCNVTCGNGKRAITRQCDKAPASTATCNPPGQSVIFETCTPTGSQCPIEYSIAAYAVQLKFQSKVVTVDLFDKLLESNMKLNLVNPLSAVCVQSQVTFEQCCPGKLLPSAWKNKTSIGESCFKATGINFYSKFNDVKKQQFSFYLAVTSDPTSSCCAKASASQNASSTRRKRTTNSGMVEQTALASILMQPEMVSLMTSQFRTIDPNAAALYGFTLPSTTTTTTAIYDPGVGATSAQGLPLWLICVAVTVVVVIVVAGVIIAVVLINKMKKARELRQKNLPPTANPNAIVPGRASTVQVLPRYGTYVNHYPPKLQQYRSAYKQQMQLGSAMPTSSQQPQTMTAMPYGRSAIAAPQQFRNY